jgi:hypothetical protein
MMDRVRGRCCSWMSTVFSISSRRRSTLSDGPTRMGGCCSYLNPGGAPPARGEGPVKASCCTSMPYFRERGPSPRCGKEPLTWVEAKGLEPSTPCLQSRCAASCATPPALSLQGWIFRATAPRVAHPDRDWSVDLVGRLRPERLLGLVRLDLAPEGKACAGSKDDEEQLLHGQGLPWLYGDRSPSVHPAADVTPTSVTGDTHWMRPGELCRRSLRRYHPRESGPATPVRRQGAGGP